MKKDLEKSETIRTYNMAEHSGWIGRMFRSNKSEIDSHFAQRGDVNMNREDFSLIQNQGAPSKAVVVFTIKE